jgi:hypothetical protein
LHRSLLSGPFAVKIAAIENGLPSRKLNQNDLQLLGSKGVLGFPQRESLWQRPTNF